VPGEPDVMTQVLDEYARDAAELIRQLHQALEEGDLPALHRAAHSLKSSSAYVGAQTLSIVCGDLDRLCKAAIEQAARVLPEGAEPLVAHIESALRQVLKVLRPGGCTVEV
jgi:HPt (histidine-containing phosphotransfer) domain-containing protein